MQGYAGSELKPRKMARPGHWQVANVRNDPRMLGEVKSSGQGKWPVILDA